MKQVTYRLFLLLSVMITPQVYVRAQGAGTGPREILGTVFLSGNRPAARVHVALENSMGRELNRTYTDDDGGYRFGRVGEGNYRVVVPAFEGYARTSRYTEVLGSQDALIRQVVNSYPQPTAGRRADGSPGAISAFTRDVPRQAKAAYEEGVKALEKGKTEKGIDHLKQAVEIFPDYYLALARLGVEYAKTSAFRNAVPLLARARQINSHWVTSQVTLGMSLAELGQFELATQALTVGKTLDPQSVNAHPSMGLSQLQLGELQPAEKNLRRAYELGGAKATMAHLYTRHVSVILSRRARDHFVLEDLLLRWVEALAPVLDVDDEALAFLRRLDAFAPFVSGFGLGRETVRIPLLRFALTLSGSIGAGRFIWQ